MEEAQVEVVGQGEPVVGQGEPVAGQGDPVAGQGEPVADQDEPIAGQVEPVAGQEEQVAVNQVEEVYAPPPRPMMNGGPVLRRPMQDEHQEDVHQEEVGVNEIADGQEDSPDEDDNLVAAPPSRKCTYTVIGVLIAVVTVILIAFLGLGLKFLLDYLNG